MQTSAVVSDKVTRRGSAEKKSRRGPAPGEVVGFEGERGPTLGPDTAGRRRNEKSLVRSSLRGDASTGQGARQWRRLWMSFAHDKSGCISTRNVRGALGNANGEFVEPWFRKTVRGKAWVCSRSNGGPEGEGIWRSWDRIARAGRGGIASLWRKKRHARERSERRGRGLRRVLCRKRLGTFSPRGASVTVGLLWRSGRGRGCGRTRRGRRRRRVGLAEARGVDGDIDFDFFGGNFLALVGAGRIRFDEEGVFEALHLAEIVEEGLPGKILGGDFAVAFPFQKQIGVRVEIEKTGITELVREFDLVGAFAEDFFLIDKFDLVAFHLVVDEGTVEIGFVGDAAEIGVGHGLDRGIGGKGIVDPAGGFAVVVADQGHAVDADLHVQLERPLALDDERALGFRTEGD